MSSSLSAPTTSWQQSSGWYKGRRCTTIRGQAQIPAGAQYFVCPVSLPPRCKPVWSAIFNQTAIDVAGGITTDATNAANAIALCFYPAAATATVPLTAPATGSSSSHTNILCLNPSVASQTSTSGQIGTVGHIRSGPKGSLLATNVQMENPQNLDAILVLRPALAVSNAVAFGSAATNTNSNMVFGAATASVTATSTNNIVNVVVYYEQFDDPNSTF